MRLVVPLGSLRELLTGLVPPFHPLLGIWRVQYAMPISNFSCGVLSMKRFLTAASIGLLIAVGTSGYFIFKDSTAGGGDSGGGGGSGGAGDPGAALGSVWTVIERGASTV